MCTCQSCFESSGLGRSGSRAASKRVPWPSNLPARCAKRSSGPWFHLSVPVPGIHHTSKNTRQQCQSLIPGAQVCSCVLRLASCVPLLVCCDSGDQRGGSGCSSYLERRGSLFSRGAEVGGARSSSLRLTEYHDSHISGCQLALTLRCVCYHCEYVVCICICMHDSPYLFYTYI